MTASSVRILFVAAAMAAVTSSAVTAQHSGMAMPVGDPVASAKSAAPASVADHATVISVDD